MAKAGFLHQRLVIVRFLRWQIQNQQAIYSGLRGGGDEFSQADAVDEVEINVEDDGNLRLLADGRNRFQEAGRGGDPRRTEGLDP